MADHPAPTQPAPAPRAPAAAPLKREGIYRFFKDLNDLSKKIDGLEPSALINGKQLEDGLLTAEYKDNWFYRLHVKGAIRKKKTEYLAKEIKTLLKPELLSGDHTAFLEQYKKILTETIPRAGPLGKSGLYKKLDSSFEQHLNLLLKEITKKYDALKKIEKPEDAKAYLDGLAGIVKRIEAYKAQDLFSGRDSYVKTTYAQRMQDVINNARHTGIKAILELAERRKTSSPELAEQYLELVKQHSENPESLFHPVSENYSSRRNMIKTSMARSKYQREKIGWYKKAVTYSRLEQLERGLNLQDASSHKNAIKGHLTDLQGIIESIKGYQAQLPGKDYELNYEADKIRKTAAEALLGRARLHAKDRPELASAYLNYLRKDNPEGAVLHPVVDKYQSKISSLEEELRKAKPAVLGGGTPVPVITN